MRTPKSFYAQQRLLSHPALRRCPSCGDLLVGCNDLQWDKIVQTLRRVPGGQSTFPLRHNLNRAKLMEMMIEGECLREMEFINQRFAGTIREALVFIGILMEELPTLPNVGFCKVIDGHECTTKELFAQSRRTPHLSARLQKGERFVYDIVRCD